MTIHRVVILRGIPGAGKSTYAKKLRAPTGVVEIVSADDYFSRDDGVYRFVAHQLPAAHARCLLAFHEAIRDGVALVVVDNTNVTAVEIAPYYALALAYDYECEIVTIPCHPHTAHGRCVHGVPLGAIYKMNDALPYQEELFPQRWEHRRERLVR